MSRGDAVGSHARIKYGIDPDELTNPWHAGLASMFAFVVGAMIPLIAILASPRRLAVTVTAIATVIALAVTGVVSAHLGGASKPRATLRTIGGGVAAMSITYAIGSLMESQL